MIGFTLANGEVREFSKPLTGKELASHISSSLAKKALAIKCDDKLMDLGSLLERNAKIKIITAQDEEGLEILRHDAAHVMAQAVQELFSDTQVTIGPVVENGFYYDFVREEAFSPDDFARIEERMRQIVDRDEEIVREVWERQDAIAYFKKIGEHYKAEIISSIPDGEDITIYRQGQWLDLCRGPHLPSTGKLGKAFKLMKLAGAYWQGDSKNKMLQRIYGTCWASEKDLKAYLTMLEEAQKRDHRKIGKDMSLFHFQEEAQGIAFWHEKGQMLWTILEGYLRRQLLAHCYQEVSTPHLLDKGLWEASGHWDKFRNHMFMTQAEDRLLALKPMNCPGHIEIFKQGMKSYRDLPLRMAEFGCCYRYEPSGALHGLMRARVFTQDDAHIFCTPAQMTQETIAFCDLLQKIYKDLGFDDVHMMFADRPKMRVGTDEVWDKAEKALLDAVRETKLPYKLNLGEGAFYGPKIEFHLRDAIGRSWQCGTLQVDFNLPERLGAYYVGEDGAKHPPILLHRAILGSMERFIGILIEHYEGKFPLWLAPLQMMFCPITSDVDDYARFVVDELKKAGLRAQGDYRNEKIGYKVREHSVSKCPIILAVGKKEKSSRCVSVRRLGLKESKTMALSELLADLADEAKPPF